MDTIEGRAAALARNPHNFGLASYGGAMSNMDYWRARFEREGMNAAAAAVDPYKAGTLASNAWHAGRAYQLEQKGRAA